MLSTIPCYQNRPIEVKDEAYKFNLLKSMYEFVPDSLLLQIRENLNDLPVCLEPPGTFSTLQLCAEICRYLHFHILHQPPTAIQPLPATIRELQHLPRFCSNHQCPPGLSMNHLDLPAVARNYQPHTATISELHHLQ